MMIYLKHGICAPCSEKHETATLLTSGHDGRFLLSCAHGEGDPSRVFLPFPSAHWTHGLSSRDAACFSPVLTYLCGEGQGALMCRHVVPGPAARAFFLSELPQASLPLASGECCSLHFLFMFSRRCFPASPPFPQPVLPSIRPTVLRESACAGSFPTPSPTRTPARVRPTR